MYGSCISGLCVKKRAGYPVVWETWMVLQKQGLQIRYKKRACQQAGAQLNFAITGWAGWPLR